MSDKIDLKALQSFSYGLYIITSRLEGKLNGQVANTTIQVTGNPPCIAVSINKNNLTHEYIIKSGMFSVGVLDESTPMTFIGLFGFKSGRAVDKFAEVPFKMGIYDNPIVTEHTLAVMEAKVRTHVDVGTHTIFVGDIVSAEVLKEGTPLTYKFYHEVKKGKSPKTAPTYMEAVKS
jgi:ferric-chelate reductase [NAD(P)H]